jgi:hypothetical protein
MDSRAPMVWLCVRCRSLVVVCRGGETTWREAGASVARDWRHVMRWGETGKKESRYLTLQQHQLHVISSSL